MRPAKTNRKIHYPLNWSELPAGDWLHQELQHRLDTWCPQLFGYHLIKLGPLSAQLNTASCTIRHQVNITTGEGVAGLIAKHHALPLQESCIDVCLLAHGINFSRDPHQLLREVERVLTADGFLILSGFNPISWHGISQYIPISRNNLAVNSQMFTPARIKDWLNLLGFEVLLDDKFGFGFSLTRGHSMDWCEKMGQKCFPLLCDNYFIVAKKCTRPITPVKEKWRLKRPILSAAPFANYKGSSRRSPKLK
ncbi:class I SAM-dependent methyltransferase [Motilimonas cestriensis]|uniref:Class I SAM-dependent methyltransferase n=1 Tax=Motilimonas cestriensis TaxID=2742685 RepID=A0ABS8WHD0_9GAMM|nr:methyltransferase domain-containing protein [Motilimonas cestriensis]MCE2596780.1 class I SAM-dependent methyltransferase [Motilimonas cestriensis]